MQADDQYTNPVYSGSFPDPFVLKYRGEYFAYCTGFAPDGEVFHVLRSNDLVHWEEVGSAMRRLESHDPFYWAPEVTYYNGKFYLYYSVGNETLMHLRVAVSDSPDGGFVDAGIQLTFDEFAIDAHVFRNDDGRWFMFYATDFLTHTHIGTGTVVDRMLDPFTLAGNPRPVTRAKYDWQVYDPQRKEKGGVRWHTVEGPSVLKRKGRYFEMFSGGNWQNITYGVSYAVTDDIDAEGEWHQHSDGTTTLPILRTIPDLVIGPGHNSVVRGPNNRELYCVYHSWAGDQRVLAIDRMDFGGGDKLLVTGPTYTPQPKPYQPQFIDTFDDLSPHWQVITGEWTAGDNQLAALSVDDNEIAFSTGSTSFIAELYLRSADGVSGPGIKLSSENGSSVSFVIAPERGFVVTSGGYDQTFAIAAHLDLTVFHLLRIEADHRWVKLFLNNVDVVFTDTLDFVPASVSLISKGAGACFSAFTLTNGFEDRFEDERLSDRGWNVEQTDGHLAFEKQSLLLDCEGTVALTKQVPYRDLELVVNICPKMIRGEGVISFGCGMMFLISGGDTMIFDAFGEKVKLDPDENKQFRLVQRSGTIDVYVDGIFIGHAPASSSNELKFIAQNAIAALDMIRLTAI